MSPVAAPADKRFRRAHVKPARRRRSWRALGRAAMRDRARSPRVLLYGVYRGVGVVGARARRCRSIASSCAATSGCRPARCWRCSSGLRGESLVWTDLDALARSGCWRRRGCATPTLRRSLPSTVEVVVSERQPIGIGRIERPAVPGRRARRDHRRVRAAVRRPRSADHRRPRRGAERRRLDDRRRRAPSWRRA